MTISRQQQPIPELSHCSLIEISAKGKRNEPLEEQEVNEIRVQDSAAVVMSLWQIVAASKWHFISKPPVATAPAASFSIIDVIKWEREPQVGW